MKAGRLLEVNVNRAIATLVVYGSFSVKHSYDFCLFVNYFEFFRSFSTFLDMTVCDISVTIEWR